jgi:SAM-dependent methyltransferase
MANIGQALILNIGGMMGYSQNQLDWVFGLPKSMKLRSFESVLDFGCGSLPRNPLGSKKVYGVDLSRTPPFEVTERLEYKQITPGANLPFENNSLDAITGFDVIEHLPRQSSGAKGNAFIETMNEFYRTLKPGGILLAVTPCYPSPAAFMDPTHVNIITPGTHKYFSDDNFAKSLSYGFIGEFRTLSAGWYPLAESWMLSSTIHPANQVDSKLTRLLNALRRVFQLVIFVLFKRARTHFIWVLEKV